MKLLQLKTVDLLFVFLFGLGVLLAHYSIFFVEDSYWIYFLFTFGLLFSSTCSFVSLQFTGVHKNSKFARLIWQIMLVLATLLLFMYNIGFERYLLNQFILKKVLTILILLLYVGSIVCSAIVEHIRWHNPYFYSNYSKFEDSKQLIFNLSILIYICSLIVLLAIKYNHAWNLTFLQRLSPSPSTLATIDALKDHIEIAAFFEDQNEVFLELHNYMLALQSNKNAKIIISSKYSNPALAEKFAASKNGYLVFRYQNMNSHLLIGESLDEAKNRLKNLDRDVARKILEVSSEPAKVYFSSGHGEMTWGAESKDGRSSIKLVEVILRQMNYSPRVLDAMAGLARDVPEDADLLIIVAPQKPWLEVEVQAVERYLKKGGNLLLLFEPGMEAIGQNDPLRKLLENLGIIFQKTVIADQHKFMSVTRSKVDHWYLYTNHFGIHPVVQSLALNERKLAVAIFESGHIELKESEQWKLTPLIMSYESAFNDKNRNFVYDEGLEQKSNYNIAIAVESLKSELHSRIVVVADASIINDELLQSVGNAQFLLDSVKWLSSKDSLIHLQDKAEDIPILRTGDEDAWIFKLSIFMFPSLMLLLGGLIHLLRNRNENK